MDKNKILSSRFFYEHIILSRVLLDVPLTWSLHSCSAWLCVFQRQWKFCFGNTAGSANRKQEGLFQKCKDLKGVQFPFFFDPTHELVLQQQQDMSGEVKRKANM